MIIDEENSTCYDDGYSDIRGLNDYGFLWVSDSEIGIEMYLGKNTKVNIVEGLVKTFINMRLTSYSLRICLCD